MPRLVRLGQRGIVFNAHHSVLPTVTRVNAVVHGHRHLSRVARPARQHGLRSGGQRGQGARHRRRARTWKRSPAPSGPLLTVPSLGEILPAAGKTILAVGSRHRAAPRSCSTTPSAPARSSTRNSPGRRRSARTSLETLGPVPATAMPNAALNKRAVDAYLTLGLNEMHPDVTLMWISDPDTPRTPRASARRRRTKSLRLVDAEIGRIEDTLRAQRAGRSHQHHRHVRPWLLDAQRAI